MAGSRKDEREYESGSQIDIPAENHNQIQPYLFYPPPDADYEDNEKSEDVEILMDPTMRPENAVIPKVTRPWFLYLMTLLQVAGLVWSLVWNWQVSGSVIETDPFNYLIGASAGVLIQMGGRSVPCMRSTLFDHANIMCFDNIKPDINTTIPQSCSVSQICAMGGITGIPNQWWRFIVPLFLHGGVLHLLFNMVFQAKTGFSLESDIGWWRMALIYLFSGVGSFIFSGIFNGTTFSPTVGCSGALYGLVACVLIDMIQNWKLIKRPWLEFFILMFQIVVLLLVGTLPLLDNFAHVGGFVTGLISGVLLLPAISFGKWDGRFKKLITFISLPILVGWFVLLIKGFYDWDLATACTWCKYLNCIPGMPWCDAKWQTTISSGQ